MKITELNPLDVPGTRPWVLLLALFLIVLGGLFLIGPLLSLALVNLTDDIGLFELQALISDPSAYTDENRKLLLGVQGMTSVGAFIAAPLIFYYTAVRGRFSRFFEVSLTGTTLLLTIAIVFSFMIVNTVFIDWNASLVLPESMRGFERWASALEEQLRELTEYLTHFDSISTFLLAVLVVAVIPAVGEELLFRGLLQNILRRLAGNAHVAVWLAALMFGMLHFQFYGMLPRVLLGALFGYLYLWSGNLWVPVLAHFVNNGLSLLFLYLYQTGYSPVDVESTEAFPWTYILIFAVLGTFLIVRFRNHYANPLPDEGLGDRIQGGEFR
jgi:uncharacterized protein